MYILKLDCLKEHEPIYDVWLENELSSDTTFDLEPLIKIISINYGLNVTDKTDLFVCCWCFFMCYCWETRIGKLLTDYFALWASLLIRTSKPVESVYLRTRIKNV